MTVRISRRFDVAAAPEQVWEFIADAENRGDAVSVVERYETNGDGTTTWHVRIPVVGSTVAIETEETVRDPPRTVEFVGRSRALRVVGEHTIDPTTDGSTVHNEFVVDGRLPGVERFFRHNLDSELENLERALRADMAADPP